VGGGKIVGSYVVTQPTEGTFEAFSYLCTHQSLPVQEVTDAAIVCGRHGSTYSLADGSVLTGPATKALTKATATVSGETVSVEVHRPQTLAILSLAGLATSDITGTGSARAVRSVRENP